MPARPAVRLDEIGPPLQVGKREFHSGGALELGHGVLRAAERELEQAERRVRLGDDRRVATRGREPQTVSGRAPGSLAPGLARPR